MDFTLQPAPGSCWCHFCCHGVGCAAVRQDGSGLRGRGYQRWLLGVHLGWLWECSHTGGLQRRHLCVVAASLPRQRQTCTFAKHSGEFGYIAVGQSFGWDVKARASSASLAKPAARLEQTMKISQHPDHHLLLPPGSFSRPSQGCKLLWIIAVMFIQRWLPICACAEGLVLNGPIGEVTSSYLELVYLVTALVPSETACLASSPGSSRRTAVWISREVMVERLL